MPRDFFNAPQNPESDEVSLATADGVQITRFTEYEFSSDFLTPADGFSFTYEPGDTSQAVVSQVMDQFKAGTLVQLAIRGNLQGVGYIDDIDMHGTKDSGLQIVIAGRSKIAYAVDACVDPRTVFASDITLEAFVRQLYAPFGFDAKKIVFSNDVGTHTATGKKVRKLPNASHTRRRHSQAYAKWMSEQRRAEAAGQALAREKKHAAPLRERPLGVQTKPYQGEGVHAFASRVLQRHCLWIWCDATGNLVVSRPDFDQDSIYELVRKSGDGRFNNIKSGGVRRSGKEQPSVIYAECEAGVSPENLRRMVRLGIVNTAITSPGLAEDLDTQPKIRVLAPTYVPADPIEVKYARPIFLHDGESRTEEQLEAFLRRELALRMRHAIVANYSVSGHTWNGAPWAVNTMASVDDDWSNVHDAMWILSRRCRKSRKGGAETHLELIQRGALEF